MEKIPHKWNESLQLRISKLIDEYTNKLGLDEFCHSVNVYDRGGNKIDVKELYLEVKYVCPNCVFHESTCEKNAFFKVVFYRDINNIQKSPSMTMHVKKAHFKVGQCFDTVQHFSIDKAGVTKIQMERLLRFYSDDMEHVRTALSNIQCFGRKLIAFPGG